MRWGQLVVVVASLSLAGRCSSVPTSGVTSDDAAASAHPPPSSRSPGDAFCTCVASNLCTDEEIKSAKTNGDIREKKCEKDTDVCCKPATQTEEVRSTTASTTVTIGRSTMSVADQSAPDKSTSTGCDCVPLDQCDGDLKPTRGDEYLLIDIHVPYKNCGEGFLHVCCEGRRPAEQDTTPMSALLNQTFHPKFPCGQRKVLPNPSGLSSDEAMFGEFPWTVALLRLDSEGKEVFLCGGSLIDTQAVLTGAHCVVGKENLFIRAGEWDTQSVQELYPTQDRNVSQVIVHEEFAKQQLANDVALLILEDPVEIRADDGHIGLVCLPEANENFDRRQCAASGWGKDTFGKEGKYAVILKKVDLPIVPREDCEEALGKTRLGSHFKLHSSFICAGGIPGKDTCKGDGGSPLVCPSKADPATQVQAGIVAWGIGCRTEAPAVYVDVAAFTPWIHHKLQQHLPS